MFLKQWRDIKEEISIYADLFSRFKPTLIPIIAIMLLSAILESVGFSLFFPLLQAMTQEITGGSKFDFLLLNMGDISRRDQIFIISGAMLVLILVKNTVVLWRVFLTSKFVNSLRCYWRNETMYWYLVAKYSAFAFKRHGVLTNNLIRETDKAACAVRPLIEILSCAFFILALFGTLLWIDWRPTLFISLATGLVIWLISKYSLQSSRRIGNEILTLDQDISSMISENIHALQEIKAFSLEDIRHKHFTFATEKEKVLLRRSDLIAQLPNPITESVLTATFMLFLVYLVLFSRMTFSMIISTLGVFLILSQRIFLLGSKIGSNRVFMLLGFPSVKLIHDFEASKTALAESKGSHKIQSIQTNILFQKVRFSYANQLVFKDLSVEIQKGKITAITGKSGIGKTTLINLLLGFFDSYEGKILVNELELRDVDLYSLRQCIGLVSQEPFMFHGTIRENIALGKPDASDEEIVSAATLAHAHPFIETFPEGYETHVAERGLTLSVGQRQRIAIARAVIRRPDLFIFDEPTSALDSESERLIAESLRTISHESTMILISHRPSTLLAADYVFKIEEGRVIQNQDTYPPEVPCEPLISIHGK